MAELGEAIKKDTKRLILSGAQFVWKCQDVFKTFIVLGCVLLFKLQGLYPRVILISSSKLAVHKSSV